MIDLKGYTGFALMKGDKSLEANRITLYCHLNNINVVYFDKRDDCTEVFVPVGSVEWCLQSLGRNVVPDYYPDWLKSYLHRRVWREDKWPLGRRVFIKPSDKYKRFTGFETTGTWKKKKKPPFWCSDILHFNKEWRSYISNGKILNSSWYWNYIWGVSDQDNMPEIPELNLNIPEGYCGAVDFGTFGNDDQVALIEAHHPFSCGWYGDIKDDEIYLQWAIDGWIYMKEGRYEKERS
jgi:hypothetical protein